MAIRKTADFVARDRELESAQEKTTEALAEHRWHWTLDESNATRVSIEEYARRVARARSTIYEQAHGYASWISRRSGPTVPGAPVSLTDHIRHAGLGADRAEAVQAVAAATGKSFGNVRTHHIPEVREVLATAQDRAERKGTTVSEELPAVAEWREKGRQAARQERDERNVSAFRLVEFEGHLGAAVRRLRQALALAREIDFTDDEVQLMEGTLSTLRTVIELVDLRITGKTGVDWDAAFAEVMEEAS